jgi:hypothetical protein
MFLRGATDLTLKNARFLLPLTIIALLTGGQQPKRDLPSSLGFLTQAL